MNRHTRLIRSIYEHGCYSRAGWKAVKELAKDGQSALDAFLQAQHAPPPSNLDPRDLHTTILSVYGAFARKYPNDLIDRFEAGAIDERSTYWALGSGTGQRSIDVLIAGLKSKNQYSRWAAVGSLIRRESKQAVGVLIDRLNDRSSLVQIEIVLAMRSNRIFRSPEALPALKRLIANKSVQKHSPGTFEIAIEVMEMINREVIGQTVNETNDS